MDATTRDIFQSQVVARRRALVEMPKKKVVREKETQKRDWKKNDDDL